MLCPLLLIENVLIVVEVAEDVRYLMNINTKTFGCCSGRAVNFDRIMVDAFVITSMMVSITMTSKIELARRCDHFLLEQEIDGIRGRVIKFVYAINLNIEALGASVTLKLDRWH